MSIRRGSQIAGAALLALVVPTQAPAHETWLDVHDWQPAKSDRIEADIRNGHGFDGRILPWLDQLIDSMELMDGLGRLAIEGENGNMPAVAVRARTDGLSILVYESRYRTLTYDSFEVFREFLADKDENWVLSEHTLRDLPTSAVREAYRRFSKALVAVGGRRGADRFTGMELELIAEANPYTDHGAPFVVQLLYNGAPKAGERVTLFSRDAGGVVDIRLAKTGADGRVAFALRPGRDYLVDAVLVRKPARNIAAEHLVMWESLWASLTFATPATDGQ
ncbi:Nickel uptake substrate-specific transmembrane region [Roseivivax jejudonensis]|uniref:Nickel uptake substrate-specific transmembrane region n=1 Tax=Roseivivax jejudonensis TaxID=1529041 RepID=A0A1X6Y7E0_9RHOB|nr:DUF4198 domain-containing protein [Roseivivax jejudonensis]SLN12932.1 Nickel uptake substrate-specific transmembrane region [Roseivivax jejudonensis]